MEKKKIIKVVLLILILLTHYNNCYSQGGIWVFSEGKCSGENITPEDGKRKALEIARSEAIRKVVGVKVNEETFRSVSENQTGSHQSEFFDIFSRLGRSTTNGKIIAEEYTYETVIENNLPVYYVKLKAIVVEEKNDPDPGFIVNIVLNRDVYYDRGGKNKYDKLDFKIEATKDCFIYLFNILSNDSVQLILPNAFLNDNEYRVNKQVQEYEKKIKSMGMNFTVGLSRNKVSQTEALYVVALREKVDFVSNNFSKDGLSIIPTHRVAITEIMNWLIEIPIDKRTEDFKQFEIRKF